jgi:hypothetical protein
MLNPSLLDLLIDPYFIDEYAIFIVNPRFNFLYLWFQDIIDPRLDYFDVCLIKTFMLIEDLSHCNLNHILMLLNHLTVFKVVRNQFLRVLLDENILISLFLGAILSVFGVHVGELPELLSFLEPRL